MINVRFKVINLSEQINIIESFISNKNSTSQYIAETLDFELNTTKSVRKKIITNLYHEKQNKMQDAVLRFQNAWDNISDFINNEFIKIFGQDFSFNCVTRVNLNPVFPRYLQEKMFDLSYECNDEYALLNTIHELVHFAWFEIWAQNFPTQSPQQYEQPHLAWLISELAIEPIFRFSNLKNLTTLNPAYDYFYTEKIGNSTIAEIANNLYQESANINDFQIKMYEFFKDIDYKNILKKLIF